MTTQPIAYLTSSTGEATFSLVTGKIIENDTEYQIDFLDVAEYQRWRERNGLTFLEPNQSVDCLLIGWRDIHGELCEPEAGARADFLAEYSIEGK